jgi:hypothetical protein
MKHIPMINGRGWTFEDGGYEWQIVSLNGSTTVRLYFRATGSSEWSFGHSRDTDGRGAKFVAETMRDFVTGTIDSAEYLSILPL